MISGMSLNVLLLLFTLAMGLILGWCICAARVYKVLSQMSKLKPTDYAGLKEFLFAVKNEEKNGNI